MIDARFFDFSGETSLRDLIAGLDVEPLDGRLGEAPISGVANLSRANAGDITFLASKKSLDELASSGATACFVPGNLASVVSEKHIIPVISNFPRTHLGRAAEKLFSVRDIFSNGADPVIAPSASVHPTAVIGSCAVIGDDVRIGPYAIVGPGVSIGAGTHIGGHVSLECCDIGSNCRIKPGACIGTAGFGIDADENGVMDLPHLGRAVLKDRVSIGCQTTVDRGQLGDTIIDDDVKIDNLVQIAHNVTIGAGTALAGHVGISGSCNIGKGVLMGGSVGLADHVNVGDGARLAARAGVMHDVPAGETWSGIPAIPIRDHMRLITATKKLIQKKT